MVSCLKIGEFDNLRKRLRSTIEQHTIKNLWQVFIDLDLEHVKQLINKQDVEGYLFDTIINKLIELNIIENERNKRIHKRKFFM